jgi:hypothetical protein
MLLVLHESPGGPSYEWGAQGAALVRLASIHATVATVQQWIGEEGLDAAFACHAACACCRATLCPMPCTRHHQSCVLGGGATDRILERRDPCTDGAHAVPCDSRIMHAPCTRAQASPAAPPRLRQLCGSSPPWRRCAAPLSQLGALSLRRTRGARCRRSVGRLVGGCICVSACARACLCSAAARRNWLRCAACGSLPYLSPPVCACVLRSGGR